MARFGTYGVVSANSIGSDETAQLHEQLSIRGFAAIRGAIAPDEVDALNASMEAVYARQCADVGGEDALARIGDADIVRCLLAYEEIFLSLAIHPRVISLVRSFLGDNFVLLMQNGIINRPERVQAQAKWHRDLNYQHWVSTQPIAVSALVCLEDFTSETGGTAFLPASHRFEQFPSPELAEQIEVTPELPKGSIIVFDSMIFHRAGLNSSGRVRRAVNHVYGAPILAQQVDIPSMLGTEPPEDTWLAGFLGYRWSPVRDVATWRRRKIATALAPFA